MISNLTVLNSAYSGSRDLAWVDDPLATKGYFIYRAFDYPTNWKKLNPDPQPGHFYRDQTQLELVKFTVGPENWVDNGTMGMRVFKLPDTPYSEVVQGRPMVASSPDDVQVEVTYQDGTVVQARPGQVDGMGQLVYLRIDQSVPEGGAVSSFTLIDFDKALTFTATFRRLRNFVDININLVRTYYTVVPYGDHGELHAPGAMDTPIVNTMEVERIDYIFAEMVRRNGYIFDQVAEPAFIFFRRTQGKKCACTEEGMEMPRTNCPSCFETGIVGGYYGPYDFPLIDADQGVLRTLDEGGVKVERQARSYVGPTPIVQDGDMVVRRNGERLVLSNTVYKSPRGTLLQQDFNLELLRPKDTRYLIPLPSPPLPVLYNPTTTDNPLNGVAITEPLFSTDTTPDRNWENKRKETSRTITWGRIST